MRTGIDIIKSVATALDFGSPFRVTTAKQDYGVHFNDKFVSVIKITPEGRSEPCDMANLVADLTLDEAVREATELIDHVKQMGWRSEAQIAEALRVVSSAHT